MKDDQRLHVTTRKAGSYFNNVQSRASRLVRDAVFARGRENLRAWLPSLRNPVTDSDAVSASDRVRREALGGALWVADRAAIRGDELSISGWIIRLPEDRGDIQPCLNGRPFERFASGEPRPDLSSVFPFVPGADRAGFSAGISLRPEERDGEVALDIEIVRRDTSAPLRKWQTLSVLPDSRERWPMPDGMRIARVHGAAAPEAFRMVGYSNVRKIERVLREFQGCGWEGFPRILDWGCGCGRLSRYLLETPAVELTGADIDRDTISWCRQHLSSATFVDLPLHPPSSLKDAGFDLIVGVSIFTHLTETVQLEWLGELQRLSARGALLLMSIHGPTIHAMSGDGAFCESVQQKGIVDGRSYDLDAVLEDKEYYRTTHHSHAYVRQVWGRLFEIVEILPACIGNMQDLVVMRRR